MIQMRLKVYESDELNIIKAAVLKKCGHYKVWTVGRDVTEMVPARPETQPALQY